MQTIISLLNFMFRTARKVKNDFEKDILHDEIHIHNKIGFFTCTFPRFYSQKVEKKE